MRSPSVHVRFTPESGHVRCSGETDYEPAMSRRTTLGYYRAAIPRTSERCNVTLNFICVPYIQRCEFDPKGLGYRPNSAELPNACRSGRVAKHQCACHIGSNLL